MKTYQVRLQLLNGDFFTLQVTVVDRRIAIDAAIALYNDEYKESNCNCLLSDTGHKIIKLIKN